MNALLGEAECKKDDGVQVPSSSSVLVVPKDSKETVQLWTECSALGVGLSGWDNLGFASY